MRRLIYFLMTMLGFGAAATSCSNDNGAGSPLPMYGIPGTPYRISARVVDGEGDPIQGIEVKCGFLHDGIEYFLYMDRTDYQGRINNLSYGDLPPYMRFIDTDGEDNGGEFETLTLDIDALYVQTGEGIGVSTNVTYELELGDVELTEVEESDN